MEDVIIRTWDKASKKGHTQYSTVKDILLCDLLTVLFCYPTHQWCQFGLFSVHYHNLHRPFFPLYPSLDCGVQSWALKPRASPAGIKTTAVHNTCSPETPLFASFPPPHPSFHSSYSYPPFSMLLCPPPSASEQVIPKGARFKPFTSHQCCFIQHSQAPQKPYRQWQPQTSVPRASSKNWGGGFKKGSKPGERQWKEAKGKLQRKSFEIFFHQSCLTTLCSILPSVKKNKTTLYEKYCWICRPILSSTHLILQSMRSCKTFES